MIRYRTAEFDAFGQDVGAYSPISSIFRPPPDGDGGYLIPSEQFTQIVNGRLVTYTDAGMPSRCFIGDYYFKPPNRANTAHQRAFIIMHEAVHLVGKKSDTDFGGSKKLSEKLIEKCFPVLKGKTGGVG